MKALLLAAGLGTRLQPLTNDWPKCLMPINKRPLLEYWLEILRQQNIRDVVVNTHHHASIVESFLNQSQYSSWVKVAYEDILLGTAGTIRANYNYLKGEQILVIHADNWCCCNFSDFVAYHKNDRPKNTMMTMMTFDCDMPESCGIVKSDNDGIVVEFYEKKKDVHGRVANAAIYIMEPEVIDWIKKNPNVADFSTQVIQNFIGRIATWKNSFIHRDIGTITELIKSQNDKCDCIKFDFNNTEWQTNFEYSPVQKTIGELNE